MHLTTTALAASALALLQVFLSVTTIRMRMKHKAAFGDAGEHALTSASARMATSLNMRRSG
ncbi:MAG: hypothetical protein ABIS51_00885 [Sphingomonas sp.]